eukprot:COSAG06_NODE_18373_length_890_cov_5.055626_1_plen_80_part_10
MPRSLALLVVVPSLLWVVAGTAAAEHATWQTWDDGLQGAAWQRLQRTKLLEAAAASQAAAAGGAAAAAGPLLPCPVPPVA